jgi:hypothetical protein
MKKPMKFLKLYSLFALCIPIYLLAQSPYVKKPLEPRVIDPSGKIDKKIWPSAGVAFYGESTLYGRIMFAPGELIIYAGSARMKKSIAKSKIASIEFKEWKAYKQGRMYKFYPVVTFIKMKNQNVFVCYGYMSSFLRFSFRDYNNRVLVYSYFVDYKKGEKWLNKKISFKKKRVKFPIKGVVTAIHFNQDKVNPYKSLFKMLSK